ncbi:MAG: antibiotic biosynthesis monooxygenase [Mycobacterium sp.]|uniref:putative quinol monooxygenase n=1 Tax=Mycobacterium sp. TaxID=1785 RepID=UPI002613CC0B|nr:antibiotic biosynthesis monooxygenase [Mycobacterium sp.]MDI3314224.1 antibiotic biosynthesis monooxygenase [Mycobacterium sp.]
MDAYRQPCRDERGVAAGFVVIATWVAKPGEAGHIRAILLEKMTPGNRAEPKMLHFQAHVSAEDPNTFVLYEHYTDPGGYEEHRATEAFQRLVVGDAISRLASRTVQTFTTIGPDT